MALQLMEGAIIIGVIQNVSMNSNKPNIIMNMAIQMKIHMFR